MAWDKIGKINLDGAVPAGGLAGQVLAKASSANLDVTWIDQASGGGLYGGIIDGGNATTIYAGAPAFDFGSAT